MGVAAVPVPCKPTVFPGWHAEDLGLVQQACRAAFFVGGSSGNLQYNNKLSPTNFFVNYVKKAANKLVSYSRFDG